MIRVLSHVDIDYERWNSVVAGSGNPHIYAYTSFLDVVCPLWKGAVLGDYDAVLPLTEKKKFGIRYLVQPRFSQQYDIFSIRTLSDLERDMFLKIVLRYPSVRLCFSHTMFGNEKRRNNYVLDLSASYDSLRVRYSENTKRNIKKATERGLVCSQSSLTEATLDFFFQCDERNLYRQQKTLVQSLLASHNVETYTVTKDGMYVAVAFFLFSDSRLYYLFPASSYLGHECSAMFLLVDTIIKEYSGQQVVLDFEGSDLSGVRRFYEGFGATCEPYYSVEHHVLSFIGKIFKQ